MKNNFLNRTFTNADQEVVVYSGESVSWRVSAYVLIIENNSILIIKNKNEKFYDVPGGGIEFGETIEEAIARELMEEAGVVAKIDNLIHVQEGFFKHVNGNFYQTIQLFHSGVLISELAQPSEETTEFVGFVQLSELDKYPLPKPAIKAISKLRATL